MKLVIDPEGYVFRHNDDGTINQFCPHKGQGVNCKIDCILFKIHKEFYLDNKDNRKEKFGYELCNGDTSFIVEDLRK